MLFIVVTNACVVLADSFIFRMKETYTVSMLRIKARNESMICSDDGNKSPGFYYDYD